MRKSLLLLLLVPAMLVNAQENACARAKQGNAHFQAMLQAKSASVAQTHHEAKYDDKFVHLSLKVNRYNKYIIGNAKIVSKVSAAGLDTFMTLLHQNLTIDSVKFNGQLLPATRVDSMVKVKPPVPLAAGVNFTVVVYYKGTPPAGGSAIGSGFSNGTSGSWGNKATWSLSESLVAYHWWPSKQILTDKIDSSWVFITTDSLNKAGSNGILRNVVTVDSLKRYEWKSRYPIDYYLISVAVAKYKEYNLYAKPQYLPNDSILIQNYIYDNAINNPGFANQKAQLNQMPQVMSFLCNMYGMYPFYKEKYGHCMAPFSGGMEHQTMTSLGFFDYYINAHELGHQWWGDQVTCKGWGDIWINEGFAAYTELLVAQYLQPLDFATMVDDVHNNVMTQPGGSCFFTGSDTLNSNRIFSSRLTYDKGAAIIHSLRFVTNNDSLWFNALRGFQNTYKNSNASVIDFKNYYQNFTGINPTQFFDQWFYGEGYPTFTMKYNSINNKAFIKSTQTVSMPSATPIFITPIEYRISRTGYPDTVVRVLHTNAVENYSFNLNGNVTGVMCDPNNWLINKSNGATKDPTLGVVTVTDTGVPDGTTIEAIRVSPNPSIGSFSILNPTGNGGTVQVFSLLGQLLVQKKLEAKTTFDLSGYPEGIYVVKVYDEHWEEQYSQKIIRQ